MSRVLGSPPRVRGKDSIRQRVVGQLRITPACAGKRYAVGMSEIASEDHPRVCGEKGVQRLQSCRFLGSPPRVRGKGTHGLYSRRFPRITPACAGKSLSGLLMMSCSKDHPRVCGEKLFYRGGRAHLPGSPPRVRGKGGGDKAPGNA